MICIPRSLQQEKADRAAKNSDRRAAEHVAREMYAAEHADDGEQHAEHGQHDSDGYERIIEGKRNDKHRKHMAARERFAPLVFFQQRLKIQCLIRAFSIDDAAQDAHRRGRKKDALRKEERFGKR